MPSQRCLREKVSQDEESPGPVWGYERVARGGFHNESLNASQGNLKRSLIDKAGLFASQFSVWRLGKRANLDAAQLAEILKERDDIKGDLHAIFSAKVSVLRSLIDPISKERSVCVVDECQCHPDGSKHAAHAHIALCQNVSDRIASKDDETFQQIVDDLHHCFKYKLEWWSDTEVKGRLTDKYPNMKVA